MPLEKMLLLSVMLLSSPAVTTAGNCTYTHHQHHTLQCSSIEGQIALLIRWCERNQLLKDRNKKKTGSAELSVLYSGMVESVYLLLIHGGGDDGSWPSICMCLIESPLFNFGSVKQSTTLSVSLCVQ